MTIKRGYIVGGGALGMLVGILLIYPGNAVAPAAPVSVSTDPVAVLAAISPRKRISSPFDLTTSTLFKRNLSNPASAAHQVSNRSPSGSRGAPTAGSPGSTSPATLVWEQNFSKQTALDPAFWNIATPSLPIYNNEAQKYYNQPSNVRLENGSLVLQAHKQSGGYSSGRVDTKGRKNIEVGSRVEARMKLPKGKGTWPAFWMLSANQPHTSKFNPTDADWQKPRFYLWDGEIDILEAYGSLPGVLESTTHTYQKTRYASIVRSDASSTFHTYWMEWRADKLTFGVDNTIVFNHTKTTNDVSDWPFTANNKYYLILNLAMGGSGGGDIIQAPGDNWKLEIASVKYFKLD